MRGGHFADDISSKRLNNGMLRERAAPRNVFVGHIHVALFDIDQMGDELGAGVGGYTGSIQNGLSSIIPSLKKRIDRHSLQRRHISLVCKNVRRLHCNELCGLIARC